MTKTWSLPRVATGIAIGVWAALFWFLIASGRSPLYLSARTTWLAPVGAITLSAAAVGRLLSARVTTPERFSSKQVSSLSILVLPAVAILAFPPVALGSFAVEKRAGAVNRGAYVEVSDQDISEGDLSLVDIFGLSYNNELHKLAARAGSFSSFTGFVTRDSSYGADEFQLNRFMISCCPGDAINIQLRVVGVPPGRFEPDDWVRVTGRIYPVGDQVVVDATEVQAVKRPQRPYLNS
jgi:uncharacterized repeat protein (TIGR03943 family)